MFENPRRGRQATNLTKNDPKILDLKSSSEPVNFPKIVVGCPCLDTYMRPNGLYYVSLTIVNPFLPHGVH